MRAGREDPVAGRVEKREEVGYAISREDVGRWKNIQGYSAIDRDACRVHVNILHIKDCTTLV